MKRNKTYLFFQQILIIGYIQWRWFLYETGEENWDQSPPLSDMNSYQIQYQVAFVRLSFLVLGQVGSVTEKFQKRESPIISAIGIEQNHLFLYGMNQEMAEI